MPDPFRKIRPGDSLDIAADAWNAMLDTIRPNGDLSSATGAEGSPRQAVIIRVKNGSGSDLARNSVLGLDGPVFTPDDSTDAFLRQPAFRGVLPEETAHKRRYGVLLDPAKDGQFARAFLAGVCQVKVDMVDPSHQFANIVAGVTGHMRSSRFGHAQILWTEADGAYYGYDTGVMWTIARLGVTTSCFAIGVATSDFGPRDAYSAFGYGTVALYRYSGGSIASCNETITAYNASSDESYGVSIPTGTWVSVAWDSDGIPFAAPLECA